MKKILILLLFITSLTIQAQTTYYIAPTNASPAGNDSNNGSVSSPFATINHAWSVASSGDFIDLRGGTYTYAMMGETVLSGKNNITIQNFMGEKPVINFSANTFASQVIGISINNANYLHIKGIRITSIKQPDGNTAQYGLILWDHVSNCTFEQIETDHIGGWGVTLGDYNVNNLFLNCDSHHNSDRHTNNGDPWGWSDGFQSASWEQSSGQASTGTIFRGCRSYWNSDDGWDLRRCSGVWTLENCWSFWNGYRPGERDGDADTKIEGGDGMGLKFGTNYGPQTTDIRKIAKSCVIFENRSTGVDLWTDPGYNYMGYLVENCVMYKNGEAGIGCSDASGASTTTFKNNVSYANPGGNYFGSSAWWVHDHNNWDIPITVTDADFASVNSVGMDGPRQADGSLPVLNFLKLTSTSVPEYHAGLAVSGLTTDGMGNIWNNPPSIGAFEYGAVGPVLMTTFTLSSAGNATTITSYHGTLQFTTSYITPSNTTDQTFVWSVINGTGSATISTGGLLTAITNGTVTVRATAHDGSGVYSDMTITLSNQVATGYATITTTSVGMQGIDQTTNLAYATSGGNVTNDGGSTVTAKGICYGTSANPTTANTVISGGSGLGSFSLQMTGLTKPATYHVRAFATNSTGTSYGTDVQFGTSAGLIVIY